MYVYIYIYIYICMNIYPEASTLAGSGGAVRLDRGARARAAKSDRHSHRGPLRPR